MFSHKHTHTLSLWNLKFCIFGIARKKHCIIDVILTTKKTKSYTNSNVNSIEIDLFEYKTKHYRFLKKNILILYH